jgi:hypothetical protein
MKDNSKTMNDKAKEILKLAEKAEYKLTSFLLQRFKDI